MKLIKINDNQNNCYIDYVQEADEQIPVIRYHIFDQYPELVTGFSTRLGGVSKEHLSSMNLSFTRGDDPNCVMENHRRFAKAVGYPYEKLVFSDQVHKDHIYLVTEKDCGKGILKDSDIKEYDGLLTNRREIPMMTFFADCVPLYLYDPVNHVLGLAHSGWRGTVLQIGSKMVYRMQEEFGSKPEHLICAIGPSICKKCYEVSKDVADAFAKVYTKEEYAEMILDKGNDKYQLDLHMACYYNFKNAGVLEDNIAFPDYCTCCNSESLFSHRASDGKRGNLAAVAMLKA